MAICEMGNGDVWIGTSEGGVSVLPREKRAIGEYVFDNYLRSSSFNGRSTFASSFIRTIMEDSYGNKWVGNFSNGVDIVSYEPPFFIMDTPFANDPAASLHPVVWSLEYDRNGCLWIGGEDEMMRYDGKTAEHIALPSMTRSLSSQCRALLCDSCGRLWVGTSNDGTYVYDPLARTFSRVTMSPREVRCFSEDGDGGIWIGTHDGLFRSADGLTAVAMDGYNDRLSDLFILDILRDRYGRMWVATLGRGVTVFDNDGLVELTLDDSGPLPSNVVNTLFVDSRDNMWMGTRAGAVMVPISRLSDLTVIDGSDGMENCDVKAIGEDEKGNIWMSTNSDIVCCSVDERKLSVYRRTYYTPLSAFTESACCVGPYKRLLFGSQNGLVHFEPTAKNLREKKGTITLTGLVAHDSDAGDHDMEIEIPIDSDKVTLPYNYNTFTLKFNNLDITQGANSDYQYNMEGVNEVWTLVEDKNEAIYRNLKPGKYQFRVRYRLNGKAWSEPQQLISITVRPPLYLTWWAKLVYITAIVLVILVVSWFYKRKLDVEKDLAIERETSNNNRLLNEERLVFFTNITHELRTPLSLIVGPIEDLVNDESLKDEHRKKLHTIRTSSMRLMNLINGILEFRKTETHNRRLEVVQGNIANYVREIGLRFKELNSNRKVSIIIDVEGMEGRDVYFDPEMITTIINNLMSNALKYTGKGSVTLSLKPLAVNGVEYFDLRVTDTGEGIPKESLPHIFRRYYQAENARKVSGTGIGLALTKNLVELHEAEITVTSEVGKGSSFSVRFLMDNTYPGASHREAATLDVTDPAAPVDESTEYNNRPVLLVVEDDKDVRDYIKESFCDIYRVVTAADGREGLEKACSVIPDIIVSDIMMPLMDGIELCKTLKSQLITSHIPVILLTAKDSITDKEEGYESGADSYITKPFSANLLRARIINIMNTRHKLALSLLDPLLQARENGMAQNSGADPAAPSECDINPLDREFIVKFRAIIEENLDKEEIDMNFLCDKMCVSNSTLYRKVKSVTGLTPNEFIRKIKLRKAAELLRSGKVPQSDIPVLTGFGSMAYFRRLFKKEYGVSPSEYIHTSGKTHENHPFEIDDEA